MNRNFYNSIKTNPFLEPNKWRKRLLSEVKIQPQIEFTQRGFLCALVTSRCHVGCNHCMFASNMDYGRSKDNTMTEVRVEKLLRLVKEANIGYFLVSGGGEGFLEPSLMYKIIKGTSADITWMVTSGFWGKKPEIARSILSKCHEEYIKGKKENTERKIFIRISVDSHHIEKIGGKEDPLFYIREIIKIFDENYSEVDGFSVMLHAIEGEESIIKTLTHQLEGSLIYSREEIHSSVKVTQRSANIRLKSGYSFPVTFAKLLLSDMAANLKDDKSLQQKIAIWEEDAYINEREKTGLQIHQNGFGNDMLVIYDGRVAGGWQCEMPDIPINIDQHNYADIMELTASDPATLATLEKGLKYRFRIIDEVNPKACIRAKAVNIRDYTSPILMEEDKTKLYYTIRATQDFLTEGRFLKELEILDSEVAAILTTPAESLISLYKESNYDLIAQSRMRGNRFTDFENALLQYQADLDIETFKKAILDSSNKEIRIIDQWRLMLLRITRDWYEIKSWPEDTLAILPDVIHVIDRDILKGKRPFEGLSGQSFI